ncbi:nonstructural protein [Blackfly microvirus SF02]|uniref:Nonstructural protein n=1 Tax=Blackfly microvirus SF02 TaxID=2576452 RepID=A0A4V1F5D2_9VIRU|nr:nonstructural protein [Blackfly microvirus SF02]
MKLEMFAVFDSKAAAFLPPFFMANGAVAVRSFQEVCNDPNTQFYKHPEDYTLYSLGFFEDTLATFEVHKTTTPLVTAASLKETQI